MLDPVIKIMLIDLYQNNQSCRDYCGRYLNSVILYYPLTVRFQAFTRPQSLLLGAISIVGARRTLVPVLACWWKLTLQQYMAIRS